MRFPSKYKFNYPKSTKYHDGDDLHLIIIILFFNRSSGLEVRDFGTSWRDGFAFLSLIDAIKTNVINIAEMKKYNNRYRLDTAFNIAEAELGIARLLDAEDVDVGSPDEKSIMTYVAQFLHKYPDVKVNI